MAIDNYKLPRMSKSMSHSPFLVKGQRITCRSSLINSSSISQLAAPTKALPRSIRECVEIVVMKHELLMRRDVTDAHPLTVLATSYSVSVSLSLSLVLSTN